MLENLGASAIWDVVKWRVRRKRSERQGVSSEEDCFRAIVQAELDRLDFRKQQESLESLGTPVLTEKELYRYLRKAGFGKPRFWEKRRRRWFTLEEAFAEPGERLSPLEVAVNEIVWRLDNKWLGTSGIHEFRARTAEQRIPGHAIMRVIRRLYGLPADEAIWVSHVRLEGSHEEYNLCLYMPGVSSERQDRHQL